ncbi:LamB/YcsF family protein [Chengkuizengella axinellae]|uniref:5-oxoprolinase subunit A n=1 Tax=Chengkuizengella axinellae TaxID=3064388 RepID=A0ABT9J4R4_9BACL|nr:5-oxoprolinase subunit PxpA [Chengkuizengella sp. 2205SS18-9]MDP5276612.1 5-oxoprolinase subunit PxpA [Chengkuizengella sp. 2205SS18-9]
MLTVDLNCDLGESYGIYSIGMDEDVLQYVTSANIACGFHAGDPSTMRKTVSSCIQNKVAIGAHPGFQDLQGFGRRNMHISPKEAYELVLYQIGALNAFVKAEGAKLNHVKPHGALYNMAAKSCSLADAIAKAVFDFDDQLILYGLAGSELIKAGKSIGLPCANEVFADRTYLENGTLTPRNQKNALIKDAEEAKAQVLDMVQHKKVKTITGKEILIQADSVCVHGDSAEALVFVKMLREKLLEEGVHLETLI